MLWTISKLHLASPGISFYFLRLLLWTDEPIAMELDYSPRDRTAALARRLPSTASNSKYLHLRGHNHFHFATDSGLLIGDEKALGLPYLASTQKFSFDTCHSDWPGILHSLTRASFLPVSSSADLTDDELQHVDHEPLGPVYPLGSDGGLSRNFASASAGRTTPC